MPKISIILPVFNAEKFISESINSILAQTFHDFEFIILNDGSTDQSLKIIKSFTDPRITTVDKQHSGLVDTLNYGINLSNSELVARMDADDIALPQRLELQFNRFTYNLAVLGGQFKILTKNNEIKKTYNLPITHGMILKNLLSGKPAIVHPSVIINKAMFLKVGAYDEKLSPAEDLDLWLRISHVGKLRNIEQKVIVLRKHEDNLSEIKNIEQIQHTLVSIAYHKVQRQENKMIDPIQFNSIKSRINDVLETEKYIYLHEKYIKDKKEVFDTRIFKKLFNGIKNPKFLISHILLLKKWRKIIKSV